MAKSIPTKVRIRKTDKFRAVLTETLPYEVPMLFSNEGLYFAAKAGVIENFDRKYGLEIFKSRHNIPYKYRIRKNSYESRGLAVMHPAQQLIFGDFYSKYDHLIVALCQRSPFSLRAPGAIASYFVERSRVAPANGGSTKSVEQIGDGFSAVSGVATSYFSYKKYALMFRFYDSTEFLTLEKKFKFLTKLDISDCFNRIYTHTIAWAAKSKAHAKKNKGVNSFEKEFDQLMQCTNHGETAGIIVGPESSRIFAEIILQRIDLDILKKATQNGYADGFDYTIRRYVDDYFIYSNSEQVREDLKVIIAECLLEYKLAVNSSKTNDSTRPFITGPSISRHRIAVEIISFFDKCRQAEEYVDAHGVISRRLKIRFISNVGALTNQTIASLKRSIGEHGSYDACANYFFGTVKKLLARLKNRPMVAERGSLGDSLYFFFCALVDIVFFYYSMTPRMRQTYVTSEIILMIIEIMDAAPMDSRDSLIRKIVHESRLIIVQSVVERTASKIEVMNLLIVLKELGNKYLLDQEAIFHVFGIQLNDTEYCFNKSFDYFQTVMLLSYVGDMPQYAPLVRAVVSHCMDKFKDLDWACYAEYVFLFFDLLTCPYVLPSERTELAKAVLKHKSDKDLNARAVGLVNDIGQKSWFFGWDEQANIAMVLKKKELRTPY